VFQTPEALHKLEMPWKGTSSPLSSLPITNSGFSWTPAWWWKGLKAVGLSQHFGWDLFRLHLLTLYYGVSMAIGTCLLCVTCRGAVPYNKIWWRATSFLDVWMESTMSLSPSFHVIGIEKNVQDQCPRSWYHHGFHWRHLRMKSALETVGLDVADQKLKLRPLSCLYLACAFGWVLRAMRWKQRLDIGHCDSFPAQCDLWGSWY
jgi:hypothetical protein